MFKIKIGGLIERILGDRCHEPAKTQVEKNITRFTYVEGPMYFLGQQICKIMEDHGWPSIIYFSYRSPETQQELFDKRPRVTRAGPWQSPHQFHEAVDIVHATKYWQAPPEYWETLIIAVRQVAEKYNVDLTHGHFFSFVDSAHIELTDWRDVRAERGHKVATQAQLEQRFQQVLPAIWKRYQTSAAYQNR